MKAQRRWTPTESHSSIKEWTWSKRNGLHVTYKDGQSRPSDWGYLREFIKAIREGREFAREVKEPS